MQLLLPRLSRAVLQKCIDATDSLANEEEQCTPKWDSVVDESRFNSSLARKNLLGKSSREVLGAKSVDLFHAIAMVARLHTSWALTPKLEEDPEFSESVIVHSAIFASAKKALTIIAAASVVLEGQGQSGGAAQEVGASSCQGCPKDPEANMKH